VWIVLTALKRPYTFVVLAVVIALFGIRAAVQTPTDIFPNINIPVSFGPITACCRTICPAGSSTTTSVH